MPRGGMDWEAHYAKQAPLLDRRGSVVRSIRLPRPLPNQAPIIEDPTRFKVLTCGRRWGKSGLGLISAVRGHGPTTKEGRPLLRGASAGGRIWWVAPTYPEIVASNIWNDLKYALGEAATKKSELERTIWLPGGGSIAVRSAENPDSLRGGGLDGVVLDEAAFMEYTVWRDVIRPALTDMRGWAIFLTTPNGKNWFYREIWEKVLNRKGWGRWQRPSSDNPIIDPEELEQIKEEIGSRAFAQEHGAAFMEVEGVLWPVEYFDPKLIYARPWTKTFEVCVIAVDPSMGKEAIPRKRRGSTEGKGQQKGDPSAIVMVGLAGGVVYVEANIEVRTPSKLIADTVRMSQIYGPQAVGFEANAFQELLKPLYDHYTTEHRLVPLPLKLIHNYKASKITRIQRLDPWLENYRFRFRPDHPGTTTLIDQLQMFPLPGYNDDGPDALEMAIRLLRHVLSNVPLDVEDIQT